MYSLIKHEKGENSFSGQKDDEIDDDSRSSLLKKIEKEIHSSDKINKPP